MFAGLTTLRKLCNHPDLVTNDYSLLVTPGNHQEGKRGSTHQTKSGAESATVTSSPGAVNGDEEGEFVTVEAAQRTDDEGRVGWMWFVTNTLCSKDETTSLRNCQPPSILLLYELVTMADQIIVV